MPLDAICLYAVKNELSEKIIGMKIDKVQQPERDVIILSLRGAAGNFRLLMSGGSGDARVHLTEHRFENPNSPPMFCMLLRKHLVSARISDITQPPAERVLEFILEAPDALGIFSKKRLVIELMGRISNIILVDDEGIIIDSLRRVAGEEGKRAVLPGLIYRSPPAQEGKLNPADVTQDEWNARFKKAGDMTADKWLISNFSGLSPLICRELSHRAYGQGEMRLGTVGDDGAALWHEFSALVQLYEANRFAPYMLSEPDGVPRDFSYMEITQYDGAFNAVRYDSFSAMLDGFYTRSAQISRVRQRAQATTKTVKNARDRVIRKLAAQHEEVQKTADRENLRECGDIITANLHLMEKGMSELVAQDFYSEIDGAMRRIPLDTQKTPQQNAAKYYKDYTKAKTAEKILTEQILFGEDELKYLESVIAAIAIAEGERDLNEIRNELIQTGYVKSQKQAKGKVQESGPMQFESSTGFKILVGRNNIQNDKLTLKTAARSDVWLHTQKIHGAHVIISCGGVQPDDTTLSEAASIAAFYSAARSGGKTPVDYTLVKHVKKPSGARPGMVIYTDFKTIMATPDEALVNRLR